MSEPRRGDTEGAIPEQSRIEELAEHFGRTGIGEPDAWEAATDAAIERPELEQVSIKLPREDVAELERRARSAGWPPRPCCVR